MGFLTEGEIAPCDQEAANVWALKSAERRGLPAFFSSEGFAGFSEPTPKPGDWSSEQSAEAFAFSN
jgi:hypothetical protein